jgi:hypothetical protein
VPPACKAGALPTELEAPTFTSFTAYAVVYQMTAILPPAALTELGTQMETIFTGSTAPLVVAPPAFKPSHSRYPLDPGQLDTSKEADNKPYPSPTPPGTALCLAYPARGETGIRTLDLLHAMQALYQAELYPQDPPEVVRDSLPRAWHNRICTCILPSRFCYPYEFGTHSYGLTIPCARDRRDAPGTNKQCSYQVTCAHYPGWATY